MTRDLKDRTNYAEMINIRDMEMSYKLEGTILNLLEAKLNLETREL